MIFIYFCFVFCFLGLDATSVSLEESWSVNGEEQESWSTPRESGGGRMEWNNSAVGQCWNQNLGQNLGQTRRRRRIVSQSVSLSLFLSFLRGKEGRNLGGFRGIGWRMGGDLVDQGAYSIKLWVMIDRSLLPFPQLLLPWWSALPPPPSRDLVLGEDSTFLHRYHLRKSREREELRREEREREREREREEEEAMNEALGSRRILYLGFNQDHR